MFIIISRLFHKLALNSSSTLAVQNRT